MKTKILRSTFLNFGMIFGLAIAGRAQNLYVSLQGHLTNSAVQSPNIRRRECRKPLPLLLSLGESPSTTAAIFLSPAPILKCGTMPGLEIPSKRTPKCPW